MPEYTLGEIIKRTEAQSMHDKALIERCIDGLGLYTSQIVAENRNSDKIKEMRKLVENLVGYWGLNDGANAKPLEDFLDTFDVRVYEAKTGGAVIGDVFQSALNVIYGLYRYGEDMVGGQGLDAAGEILNMSELIQDIADHWDFEPQKMVADLTDRLKSEVRVMLDEAVYPGQPVSGVSNVGYEINRAVMYDNGLGFVQAHDPEAPAPFVTWRHGIDDEGGKWYEWGHYFTTEDRARIDFITRAADYVRQYKVTEKPLPTAAAEMDAEQNYNMIDGVPNNVPIPKSDLTDGQTYEELRELAPEMLYENHKEEHEDTRAIPVEVHTKTQPMVSVPFSEHARLRGITAMPLYLANILFAELDAKTRADRADGGAPYYKTDFRIDFIRNGQPDSYTGSYDVGDGNGSLVNRIYDYAFHTKYNHDYQLALAQKGGDEGKTINARLAVILEELVPYFNTHVRLSEMEAAALSELMGIHDAEAKKQSIPDVSRISYLESVVHYTSQSRETLNRTGLESLLGLARPAAETVKGEPALDEKPSVIEKIRAAQKAPKQPREPKPDKKKNGPEL